MLIGRTKVVGMPGVLFRGEEIHQSRFLFRAGDEIQRTEVVFPILRAEVLIGNNLHQKARGFLGTRSPDDIAPRWSIPMLTGCSQPGVQVRVPLLISANSQSLQVPSVAAIVLGGELRP